MLSWPATQSVMIVRFLSLMFGPPGPIWMRARGPEKRVPHAANRLLARGLETEPATLRARAACSRGQLGLTSDGGGELSGAGPARGALSRVKE